MDPLRHFFAVLVVCFVPPALVWWLAIHPFVNAWRRAGPAVTLILVGALSLATAGALYSIRERLLVHDLGANPLTMLTAAVLLTAATVISLKRRHHLTTRILLGVPELEEGGHGGELLDQGIYSRIRHPRYVEIILGVAAYAAFANFTGAWIVAGLTIPGVHLVVLLEERELRARFGATYVDYTARVPRYIPRRG